MFSIINLINAIVSVFVDAVYYVFFDIFDIRGVTSYSFNIYLFSDTGWFNEPIPIIDLLAISMGIFTFIFLLRLLYKATKKFITMIFGVFRV